MNKQIISLLAAIITLTSCSGTPIAQSQSTISQPIAPPVPMGRYIEKDVSPPFEKNSSALIGNIYATDHNTVVMHTRAGPCQTFISENGVWNSKYIKDDTMLKAVSQKYLGKDTSWFYSEDDAKPYIRQRIMLGKELVGPDGYIFASGNYSYSEDYSMYGEEIPEKSKSENFVASYNGVDARYYNYTELQSYDFSRISRQNVLIALNAEEYIFYDLSVEGGKRLGTLSRQEVEKAEPNGRLSQHSIPLAVIEDTVAIALNNTVELYSMATNKKITQIELANVQKICEGVDGTFYALSKEGIWRILPQGGVLQRVLDGSSYSFSAPSFDFHDFTQDKNGDFYMLGTSNNVSVVYKYEFSANTPLERETTLHLWALRDSPIVREAAARFMRSNPEIKIYVEILPPDTQIDIAVDNLVTALAAGTGPDIIITDGIDLHKLDQQSVLAPISSEVSLLAYDKRLLPYGQVNDRQIALPTKIFITRKQANFMSYQSENFRLDNYLAQLKNAPSYEQLANKIKDGTVLNIELLFESRDEMYNIMYVAACADIWKSGFDKDAASLYLQIIKECDRFVFDNTDGFNIANAGFFLKDTDYKSSTSVPVGLYDEINAIAGRMVSYSASSQYKELCESFINTMLSDEVQKASDTDGQAPTQIFTIGTGESLEKKYFALDCLYKNSNQTQMQAPKGITITTMDYYRDAAFKAIAIQYIDDKIDLDTALAQAGQI